MEPWRGDAYLELWPWRQRHCWNQARKKAGVLGDRYPDVFFSHSLPAVGGNQTELNDKSHGRGAGPRGTEQKQEEVWA